jgi:predicted ATPase/DNA-binding winged helix-turn-helix (wHTH) protein
LKQLFESSAAELVFGPFRFFPLQRIVLRDGTPLRLGSRAREILVALVERAGEVVKKRELIERVWPDTVVDEGALRVHIAALRKALGQGQAGMRYVENVTGQGYRFVAPVMRVGVQPSAELGHTEIAAPACITPSPPARLIGRAPVISSLPTRLPLRRFVSIVGPGGVGKTAVALTAIGQLNAGYPHGTRFVDFASITDPRFVPTAVGSALGLAVATQDEMASIVEWLKGRQLLLVLDNCEHVIGSAAVLAEALLTDVPSVHILATSREPLRAKGEWVVRLAPLELPPPEAELSADEALGFSAIQLFAERAMESLHSFELTDADVPVVAEICRKLDGLPLAIELAAARVDLFGIRGLVARLDDPLGLLIAGRRTAVARHQTIQAALDWSYGILSPVEQLVLRRIAVFSACFDLTSARLVAVDEEIDAAQLFEVLTNLAAQSLLTVYADGARVRYRLLNTSRAYVLGKLLDSPESAEIRKRHSRLLLAKYPPCGASDSVREQPAP